MQARLAKTQRNRVLEKNGGIVPQLGHKDYRVYCIFCKACGNHFALPSS